MSVKYKLTSSTQFTIITPPWNVCWHLFFLPVTHRQQSCPHWWLPQPKGGWVWPSCARLQWQDHHYCKKETMFCHTPLQHPFMTTIYSQTIPSQIRAWRMHSLPAYKKFTHSWIMLEKLKVSILRLILVHFTCISMYSVNWPTYVQHISDTMINVVTKVKLKNVKKNLWNVTNHKFSFDYLLLTADLVSLVTTLKTNAPSHKTWAFAVRWNLIDQINSMLFIKHSSCKSGYMTFTW